MLPSKKLFLYISGFVGFSVLVYCFDNLSEHKQTITAIWLCGAVLFYYIGKVHSDLLAAMSGEKAFRCEFVKEFYAHGTSPQNLDYPEFDMKCELKVPFAPQKDMSIADLSGEEGVSTGKIIEVNWYYGRFRCKVEPFLMREKNEPMLIINNHTKEGWKVDTLEYGKKYQAWKAERG